MHGGQDLPDLKSLYLGFSDMPVVSISNAQRKPIPNANFVATVYHGLPLHLLKPTCRASGGYVAFLGRISPEKRPDRAIRIARALGFPIKIAAKIDKVDEAYFREKIVPLLNQPGVEFIGEIDERCCGSVPEIIDPGVTGSIVRTMTEAIRTLPQVLALDRRTVRQRFEQRFSATRMAKDYIQVYGSVLKRPSLMERRAVVSRLEPKLEKEMS